MQRIDNSQIYNSIFKIDFMKKFIAIIFSFILFSCIKEIGNLSDLKSDFYELQNHSIHMNDTLSIKFDANTDKIDSVSLLLNGKHIHNNSVLDSIKTHLGLNDLEINVYTKEGRINGKTKIPVLSQIKETPIEYKVFREYPHPKQLFTEGFFYYDGLIYESTGKYKKLKLVNYKLGTTKFLKEVKRDDRIFAEGITLFDNKIYQLTYRERQIFVYDVNTFELVETLQMPAEMREGWGLTSNGSELIASDGSHLIYFFDKDLKLKRKIQVVGNISIYEQINELEYINGKIFANVWLTNYILVINPENGRVERYYDLSNLKTEKDEKDDVLNGIAFYEDKLLVTGKHWSKIYELSLPD